MVQDAQDVTLAFHDDLMLDCVSDDGLWSRVMTLHDADPQTLWFTNSPVRLAHTANTVDFAENFAETFSEASRGLPNAMLAWDDPASDHERFVVVELDNPQVEQGDEGLTLSYDVCVLPIDNVVNVQPEDAPALTGHVTLFIDGANSADLSRTNLSGLIWFNTTCLDGNNSDNNSNTCEGHL